MFAKIKSFINNYWYYYKWYVLGGLFLLFALVVVIVQSATVERYDASVIWAMKGYVDTPYVQEMEKELEKYCEDVDGNGEVNVRVILVTYTTDGGMPNSEVEFSMQQRLITQLSAGDVYIVITDETAYENHIAKLNAFENLEDEYPDNSHVDGCKYYLKDTVFTQNEMLSKAIDGDVFMIMGSEDMQKLNLEDEKLYEKMREAFDRIVKAG